MANSNLMRLDKILCHAGHGTRLDMRIAITKKRVCVDGLPVLDPAKKVDGLRQVITLDGENIDFLPNYTYILHKPVGVITATEDREQKTVFDLLPQRIQRLNLSPVGRLDKDTTGLLLLTTDGDLLHKLTSPRSKTNKVYRVKVEGEFLAEHVERIAKGLTLPDGLVCRPGSLEILSSNEALLTIHEGKFHQVKRMMASLGCPVLALHRTAVGGLSLPVDLAEGEFRRLSESELSLLQSSE